MSSYKNNEIKLSYEGQVRRIDLLLRTEYPYLKTKIYKISMYNYVIQIDENNKFDSINNDFEKNIKYFTCPVKLSTEEPERYIQLLNPILDSEISCDGEGLPYTELEVINHIQSKHKDVAVTNIITDQESKIIKFELHFDSYTDSLNASVKKTIDSLKLVFPYEVTRAIRKGRYQFKDEGVLTIYSSQSQARLGCEFIERDEELWFENHKKMYSGELNKEALYYYDANKTKCLVNFSTFENINLKNHLLLYDVVYCILPLRQNMNSFLSSQKIKKDDFIYCS